MTTFFKTLALSLFAFGAVASTPKQQFIVVLDLSDRILIANQTLKDQAIVMAVFDKFEAAVRKNLFIHSDDAFKVLILPQIDAANFDDLENSLSLEMSRKKMGTNRIELERFKKDLPLLLKNVYALATKGNAKSADFKGSDIWRFFNDELPSFLDQKTQNHLFVITDGYFDFESNRFVGTSGNRRTDSKMLAKFRNKENWKLLLSNEKEGLIPVQKAFFNLDVAVFEIRPKFQNLNEQDLLVLLWSKWLKEMKISNKGVLPSMTMQQTKALILKL